VLPVQGGSKSDLVEKIMYFRTIEIKPQLLKCAINKNERFIPNKNFSKLQHTLLTRLRKGSPATCTIMGYISYPTQDKQANNTNSP
jgi:hypothetical protein